MALTVQGAITSSPLTIYTANEISADTIGRKFVKLTGLTISNGSGSTAVIDIHLVRSGGSVAATNKIVNTYSMLTGTSSVAEPGEFHLMNAGDFIAIASTVTHASLIYTASFEVVGGGI